MTRDSLYGSASGQFGKVRMQGVEELRCDGRPAVGNRGAANRSVRNVHASGEVCRVVDFAWEKESW